MGVIKEMEYKGIFEKSRRKIIFGLCGFIALSLLVTCSTAYTNSQYGFSYDPPSGWQIKSQSDVLIAFEDPNSVSNINIIVNKTMGFGLSDHSILFKQLYPEKKPEYHPKVINENDLILDQRLAHKISFELDSNGVKVIQDVVLL